MFTMDHIALNVSDLGSSRNFYEIMGAEVTSRPSELFMELRMGGVTLHLLARGAGDLRVNQCIDHFALRVSSMADLDSLASRLNRYFETRSQSLIKVQRSPSLGSDGPLESQPPDSVLYFRDPDGNSIEVRSY